MTARFLLLIAFYCICFPGTAADTKPNFIIILADDLGYSDLGCYGGEIQTPSLDRLASEGVRLTRFYNAGMCVTSRASLLTGQWWPRSIPPSGRISSLPEQLNTLGYHTGLIGKWHQKGHPLDRGFDHFFGFLNGSTDHFSGGDGYRLNRKRFTDFGPDYYSSDAFSDRAIQFIQNKPKDRPFFLYLSYQAPHNPLQAPEADILKYRGTYLKGWKAIREARLKRQQKLGIIPFDLKPTSYPENLPDWESLSEEQKDLEDLRMSVYAAMVERMDRGIGRVMDALKNSGHAENTLVLFMSDNGTDSFSVADQAMLNRQLLPGDPASNFQPGTGWAYASVTPWRLYKISQHNGGVASGAIAWWNGDKGEAGRIEHSPVHMVDVLPTFLEAVNGTPQPENVDGESFLPLLQGKSWKRNNPTYFQFMDNRAIRTADWTLAEVDGSGWELFHTTNDPAENINVLDQHPEKASSLEKQWGHWWTEDMKRKIYVPKSTANHPHYNPQGDRGSGKQYVPSVMPNALSDRIPVPAR